jgi:hypothetical protein
MTDCIVDSCLYVYAIVDSARPVDGPEWRLRSVASGSLSAVCSDFDPDWLVGIGADPVDGRLASLARRHDAIVRALAARGTVLPVRLGTLCADEHRLEHALQRAHPTISAQLDEVRGCTEWTVRVRATGHAEPDADASTGASYLLSRREARRQAEQDRATVEDRIARLHHELRTLARRSRSLVGAAGSSSRCYLVPAAAHDLVRSRLATAARELAAAGADLDCDGPLPPYHFVDVRLEVAS